MNILGISAYYHDAAAAVLVDGEIKAAAQEERFTRQKHDASFPRHAIAACLEIADLSLEDIDHVVFYEKPFLKFERLLETYVAAAPRGFRSFCTAMPLWIKQKLGQKQLLAKELSDLSPGVSWQNRLLFSEHHLSHAASAFYPSPFDEALVVTLDGVGEWTTTSAAIGKGSSLRIIKEIPFPHSLGLLYSAFTYHAGFRVNSGEYKLMGLAPYGVPRYADLIRTHLVDVKPDGSFRLDQRYFDYCTGLTMTNGRFDALFNHPPRDPETEPLEEFHMDMAASIQKVTEDILLALTRNLAKETGCRALCLAGGVALNCVANGKILADGMFEKIWVQPAAGDSGGALGAALAAHHLILGAPRQPSVSPTVGDAMKGSYLGPSYSTETIRSVLSDIGARFEELDDEALFSRSAQALANGQSIGWFQGRMEFGPRALGNRSILADPRSPNTQKTLNLKIKFRESFRPFAPAILREHKTDWFDLPEDADSPYMLMVAPVATRHRPPPCPEAQPLHGFDMLRQARSCIPAVTHVDYSARVQTVDVDTNPRFHALLSRFLELTGCPILVNTSFNVRGEPIVATPTDAFQCFMGTDLDCLVVGNCFLTKDEQRNDLRKSYRDKFAPD